MRTNNAFAPLLVFLVATTVLAEEPADETAPPTMTVNTTGLSPTQRYMARITSTDVSGIRYVFEAEGDIPRVSVMGSNWVVEFGQDCFRGVEGFWMSDAKVYSAHPIAPDTPFYIKIPFSYWRPDAGAEGLDAKHEDHAFQLRLDQWQPAAASRWISTTDQQKISESCSVTVNIR